MRIFTSKGFIEVPTAETTVPSSGLNGSLDAAQKRAEQIRKQAINDPNILKNASKYKAAEEYLIPQESADQQKKNRAKSDVDRVVKDIEDYYFANKLHFGWQKGLWKEMAVSSGLDKNSRYATYKAHIKSLGAKLAKASGDVGNIAVVEQLLQTGAFPQAMNTKAAAIDRFNMIRKKFDLDERKDYPEGSNLFDLVDKYSK